MKNKFKNIILLGEMHGTEGNLWALQRVLDELDREYTEITVALELPIDWNNALQKLEKGHLDALLTLMNGSEEVESGRISKKHIEKYLELAKQGVKFVAIRENNDDWNTTDEIMAKNILKVKKSNETVIVTLGNLHVEKINMTAIWCEEYMCHPVGELLKDTSTSILIRYANTEYINFGKIGKVDNKACKKHMSFNPVKNNRYDYEICIHDAGTVID